MWVANKEPSMANIVDRKFCRFPSSRQLATKWTAAAGGRTKPMQAVINWKRWTYCRKLLLVKLLLVELDNKCSPNCAGRDQLEVVDLLPQAAASGAGLLPALVWRVQHLHDPLPGKDRGVACLGLVLGVFS